MIQVVWKFDYILPFLRLEAKEKLTAKLVRVNTKTESGVEFRINFFIELNCVFCVSLKYEPLYRFFRLLYLSDTSAKYGKNLGRTKG